MDERITITHVVQYADGFVVTLKNLDRNESREVFMDGYDYNALIVAVAYTGTAVQVGMQTR